MPDHSLAGILYASFVYGHGETLRGPGLLFNDQDEASVRELCAARPNLELLQTWQSADPPPARADRVWLNINVKNVNPLSRCPVFPL